MKANRNAHAQMAFRVEPEIASEWARLVADSLVPNRAHHACAMLMYMSASPQQREAAQRAYARLRQDKDLGASLQLVAAENALSRDESELLAAYRNAAEKARDEAIADLLDKPERASRNSDIGETRDFRAG